MQPGNPHSTTNTTFSLNEIYGEHILAKLQEHLTPEELQFIATGIGPQVEQVKQRDLWLQRLAACEAEVRKALIDNFLHECLPEELHILQRDLSEVRKDLKAQRVMFGHEKVEYILGLGYKVQKGGMRGLIDEQFNEILPYTYTSISKHESQMNSVSKDDLSRTIIYRAVTNELSTLITKNDKKFVVEEFEKLPQDQQYIRKATIYRGKNGIGLFGDGFSEILSCLYDSIAPYKNTKKYILTQGHKQGLIDDFGKIILPVQFDDIDIITGPGGSLLYLVRVGDMWGIVNSNLKKVVAIGYDAIRETDEGLQLQKGGAVGLCDMSGTVIVPCVYTHIRRFSTGIYLVSQGNRQGLYKNGREMLSCLYTSITQKGSGYIVQTEDGCGWCDELGNEIIPCQYEHIARINDSYFIVTQEGRTGLVCVSRDTNKDTSKSDVSSTKPTQHDRVSSQIKTMIPYAYDTLAVCGERILATKNLKKGLLSYGGEKLLPCIYDDIKLIHNQKGMYDITYLGKHGVFYKNNIVVPCYYDEVLPMGYGYFSIQQGEKVGVMRTGKTVLEPCFESVTLLTEYVIAGSLGSSSSATWHMYDHQGKKVADHAFRSSRLTTSSHIIAQHDNKKYGVYDPHGKEIIPCAFDRIEEKSYGYIVKSHADAGGMYGLYSHDGKEIVPPGYDNIINFHNGFFEVIKNNKRGIYSAGECIIPCQYDKIELYDRTIFLVSHGNLHGAYSIDGTCIAQCEYGAIGRYGPGVLMVLGAENMEGLISYEGQILIPCKYMSIETREGYRIAKRKGVFGMVEDRYTSDGRLV